MNRDDLGRMAARAAALGIDLGAEEMLGDDGRPLGMPESDLGWRVDVRSVLDRKQAALAARQPVRHPVDAIGAAGGVRGMDGQRVLPG